MGELSDYFQDLNRDYRYQLTSIGAPGRARDKSKKEHKKNDKEK